MMKKLTLILLTALLSVGAWAETAVLATSTMDAQASGATGPAGASTAANNVMVGKTAGIGTGWVLQCTKLDKGCTGNLTMTVDETNYTSLKNSNGAKHTVKVPDGYVATSVTFYAVSNYTYDATNKTAKLSEFNGETCADEVADKGATPTAITKLLGYATSFTFTFSVTQVNYLIVVTYQEALPEYTFGIGRNVTAQGTEPETYVIDAEDAVKGSYPEQITNVTIASSTNIAWITRPNEPLHSFVNDVKTEVLASKCANNRVSGTAVASLSDNFYFGYTFDIAEGYRLNITNIAAELAPSTTRESSIQVKIYQVTSTSETLLYAGDAVNATSGNVPTYSKATGAVTALQGLNGKIAVRMLWIQGGSSTYAALRDLNIKASVEEVSMTGKEYALKEVKINDVTYDYVTNGPTVSESYASLPSVKFIYSVKKVWSDGVKTDAEDEEEVVTPTLVGGNQVATTTKLADAVALTFTDIAQFQVVPNAVGTYIDLSQAIRTNCKLETGNKAIGSTHNGSTMTIDLKNNTAGDYILQFLSGASGLTATVDINVKGSDYDKTQSFNIANTGGNWDLKEFHAMALKDLPAGNLTLKLTVTGTSGSYAGNYGNFAVYPISSYNQCDGTNFDLTKGTYAGGARYEADNQNVGYVVNGASAEYTMYNATEGVATLHMGLTHYGDGTVNVTVKDMLTGTTELTTSFVTTTDFCKGYNTPSDIQLGQLTTGLKSIRFDFAIESGFICNYKNMNVTIKLPTITLIDAVLNGSTNAPTVTGTYAGSAVANTQATADANGGYKLGSNGCYVGLTLAEGYTFKAGDVLHVNVTTENGGGSKLALYADQGENLICVSDIYKGTGDLTFTLTEAFNGLTTFYLYRSSDYGWNGFVKSVSVTGVERERVEQTYSVNYSLGESGALGTVPAAIADENILTKYVAPVNQTLYKEGYTLKGWTDGENEYLIGQSYDMAEGEHNLTPVFVANTVALGDAIAETTIHWEFQTKEGAPVIAVEGTSKPSAILVAQATVNGETIDVCLNINAVSGKFNNSSHDDWAQVNNGTILTFPSCARATVTGKVYANPETTTLDGAAYTEYADGVATWTANPTDGLSTLTVNDGQYYAYLQVVIPAHATISDEMTAGAMTALNGFNGAVTINRSLTAGMFNTICLPFAMTAAEISEKLGTCDIRELSTATLNDNVLVLDFAPATTIEAGKAYLIKPAAAVSSWTMENVTLSTTINSTTTTSADFIGVLTPTELTASENTLCVGANSTLFYVGETNTMKGLRAYFQVKGAAAGAPARISLGSHVVTDLENVDVNAKANKLIEQGRVIIRIEGHDYDLNGHLLK